MSFLTTAVVSGVLSRLLSWKVIVLLYLPLIILFWIVSGDQEKQIQSKGTMKVTIDQETKLPIIDISTNNPLGDQSFHAAVFDKDFLIKGVETTVIVTKKNLEKNARNRDDYEVYFYSDILNSNCLPELKKSVDKLLSEEIPIQDLVMKVCGKAVYPYQVNKPSNQIVRNESIDNFCSSSQPCASCVIIAGEDAAKGSCEPVNNVFHDWSRYIKNGDHEQLIFDVRPAKKLGYMSYVPR